MGLNRLNYPHPGSGGWSLEFLISGETLFFNIHTTFQLCQCRHGVIGNTLPSTSMLNSSFKHTVRYAWGVINLALSLVMQTQAHGRYLLIFWRYSQLGNVSGDVYVDTYSGSTDRGLIYYVLHSRLNCQTSLSRVRCQTLARLLRV